MITKNGKIHGVTSAAVIWLQAGIGMMIGLGYNSASFIFTAVIILSFTIARIEKRFPALRQGVHKDEPER